MKSCRECQHQVSEQAFSCPNCGAPYPAKVKWDGWGFEYKSHAEVFGLPLLHISFKYRANKVLLPLVSLLQVFLPFHSLVSVCSASASSRLPVLLWLSLPWPGH